MRKFLPIEVRVLRSLDTPHSPSTLLPTITALDDSLKERRAALLREAAEIEEQAQQVELYRKRIEDTKRLLESVTGGINRTIRDIYGLDYYISRH